MYSTQSCTLNIIDSFSYSDAENLKEGRELVKNQLDLAPFEMFATVMIYILFSCKFKHAVRTINDIFRTLFIVMYSDFIPIWQILFTVGAKVMF